MYIAPFALATRLVTVSEMKAFIREGGYREASLWLADGFDFVRENNISAPLYSRLEGDDYILFSLGGQRVARDDEPVAHVSFYEADAIASFLGGRLPTEAEWEVAAATLPVEGNFRDSGVLAPAPSREAGRLSQMFGDLWEWTRSAYEPYPGFQPAGGALGEYNGKFMIGQVVLRGGSCFTPRGHVRASYRNFWYPDTRFQMSGIRLAKDV